MKKKVIGKCPVCGNRMRVTELKCPSCHTKLSGDFELGKFSQLSPEQLDFVEVFIRLRGNIKEVEEEMDISYPTVRKKLDEVIKSLGYKPEESPDDATEEKQNKVLSALENGEIEFEEAKRKLQEL